MVEDVSISTFLCDSVSWTYMEFVWIRIQVFGRCVGFRIVWIFYELLNESRPVLKIFPGFNFAWFLPERIFLFRFLSRYKYEMCSWGSGYRQCMGPLDELRFGLTPPAFFFASAAAFFFASFSAFLRAFSIALRRRLISLLLSFFGKKKKGNGSVAGWSMPWVVGEPSLCEK